MREPSRNVSVETVRLADELAIAVLNAVDREGLLTSKADAYRRSRMQDATEAQNADSAAQDLGQGLTGTQSAAQEGGN